MESNLQISILKTLLYSDIFSYPLSFSQLHIFLITAIPCTKEELRRELKILVKRGFVKKLRGFYVLDGKENLIELRKQNALESKKKMKKAKRIARILSLVPTVDLIGISGSLSLSNAKKTDDIDFFIITQENTLWITRFLVTVILLLISEKRGKEEKFAQNKICPNMYMASHVLEVSKKNLYSAREISQLRVVFDRKNTYSHFLYVNKWVQKYLGNVKVNHCQFKKQQVYKKIIQFLLMPFELLSYKIQRAYMKKRLTYETVSPSVAQFHPLPHDQVVLSLYQLRLKYLQESIKKSFPFETERVHLFSHNLASFYDITPGS